MLKKMVAHLILQTHADYETDERLDSLCNTKKNGLKIYRLQALKLSNQHLSSYITGGSVYDMKLCYILKQTP